MPPPMPKQRATQRPAAWCPPCCEGVMSLKAPVKSNVSINLAYETEYTNENNNNVFWFGLSFVLCYFFLYLLITLITQISNYDVWLFGGSYSPFSAISRLCCTCSSYSPHNASDHCWHAMKVMDATCVVDFKVFFQKWLKKRIHF